MLPDISRKLFSLKKLSLKSHDAFNNVISEKGINPVTFLEQNNLKNRLLSSYIKVVKFYVNFSIKSLFPISFTSRSNLELNNNFYQYKIMIVSSVYIQYLFHPQIFGNKLRDFSNEWVFWVLPCVFRKFNQFSSFLNSVKRNTNWDFWSA